MQDVLDQRWAFPGSPVTWRTTLAHLSRGGCFVLEDHAGYPIDCPLCGRADGWRVERAPGMVQPHAFACRHTLPDGRGGTRRLSASVSADHVGGYLDPVSLLTSAA